MSVEKPAQLDLCNRLAEVIGPENADTQMSSVALHPGVELATNADLAELRSEPRAEMSEIRKELRTQTYLIIGAMTVLTVSES